MKDLPTAPLTIYQELKIDTQIRPEQVLKMLQRTPKSHIYTRPARGGGSWDYVTGTYVKKVLNYTFGFLWSSQVMSIEEKHGQVIATVRLTIHKPNGDVMIWKEDIGKKEIAFKKNTNDPLDYGNDQKAAVTDGLKRCASQFGIASDVYGKEEFKEIKKVDEPKEALSMADDDEPATQDQINAIHSLGLVLPEGKFTKGAARAMMQKAAEKK